MALQGHNCVRAHPRVAYTPAREASVPSRGRLLVRAMLVRFRIVLLNVVAFTGAVAALAPLLVRRGPLRQRRATPRGASAIPLEERRRASPT